MDITKESKKVGSALETWIPFILLLIMIGSGIFIYMFFFNEKIIEISSIQQIGIVVNVDFINSDAFTSLKYIPDEAVFNDVTGTVPSGKPNPFAP